jgi:OCT family organic anion transporter-like MFS transporter 7
MTVLSIVGTTVCNAAFDTGYIYATELFPTVLRTTALSTASASARVGSLLTPLVGTLDTYDPMLPVACFGVVVLLAGLQAS